ncbi:hypothetical protein EC957_001372 [Mortierella hygrophila]|uniref:Uncharacterized protein n=1 Tax=Mortierella hygrophila TaxID=979708 RepID=A0A9P6K2P5_9FUNG|nr:hypothetical protein EC957_001372 [Mortierella hygrophila]
MKPQLGQSKLAILKHAPTVYRKRRPVDLRNRHGTLLGLGGLSNDYSPFPTAQPPGTSPLHHIHTHNHGHNHTHSRPPPLLRRQTTITRGHKSFMDIDLPSIRALCREPSMMELDPPTTLFAPTPSPAHFLPGPWAFFQAAEAQRAQRQTQMEFLTRLQELRARDEQCFVQMMAGFAKECPVQFAQLTEFMRRMENELASAAAQEEQQNNQNSFLKNGGPGGPFQQGHQQQQRRYSHTGVGASQDYWGRVQEHRESRGTKMGLLELAQLFGNQVQARSSHGERFHRDQQQQHLQQLRQQYGGSSSQLIDRRASLGTIGTGGGAGGGAGNGKGSRHGGRNGRPGGINGQSRSASMPVLRRGKTFQQQQQAMQQLTAYQRQLYQHVQQVYQQQQQQQQQHLGYQSPLGNGSAGNDCRHVNRTRKPHTQQQQQQRQQPPGLNQQPVLLPTLVPVLLLHIASILYRV